MQPVEAQMVRGRLITGPIAPLQRMRTLVGGWGLPSASGTHGQALASPPKGLEPSPAVSPAPLSATDIDVEIDVELEDNHFIPPPLPRHKGTVRFGDAWPPIQLQSPLKAKQAPWREVLISRTAIAAGLVGAFLAGMMWFRHGVGRTGDSVAAPAPVPVEPTASVPPAAPAEPAAVVAPAISPFEATVEEAAAPPAAAAPVVEPEDSAPVAAPPTRPHAPATTRKVAATEARPRTPPAGRPLRAQRQGKASSSPPVVRATQHPSGWTDPFDDGSWVDLPKD